MKVVIMVCTKKKIVQDKCAILGPKMAHPHNSGSAPRIFLKFSRMNREVIGTLKLFCFLRKNFILGNLIFLTLGHFLLFDWSLLKLSQATVTIGSLNSQDMIRILKQSRHDFSGKHLCDGYCIDIKWCLCVEVKVYVFVKLFFNVKVLEC